MSGPISRREFFGSAAREGGRFALELLEGWGAAAAAFAKPKRRIPPPPTGWVRPPNALPEADFLSACTKCGDCLTACPHYVLRKLGPECGTALLETPVLFPRENPCQLCEGVPCAAACGTGALRKPAQDEMPRLGAARVATARCYSAQGQPCDYCVTACPEKPKAMAVRLGRAAQVVRDDCTGCGRCVQICPTEAVSLEAAS
ncbi:MAG: 4Fe-4S dicluster domain-containing protein [Elusimicrobia bacterium]|nr:4Fe-4S dicluster domain-containing protein [Elusimicrobiota bacterium]